MHPNSFASFRLGLLALAPLAWCASPASAQMMVYPELICAYTGPAAEVREPAPEDPAAEPIVALASLVLALSEALDSGALALEPKTALAVELHLSSLIDRPVLSRLEAGRFATELTTTLEPRQLIVLAGFASKRDYAGKPWLLGADSATANPFYDPGSIPGYGARFVLGHIESLLHPAETVAP